LPNNALFSLIDRV